MMDMTGNSDIDTATAEIAILLRNACRVMCTTQDHYNEAAELRNRIMAGTRAMDAPEPPLDDFKVGSQT